MPRSAPKPVDDPFADEEVNRLASLGRQRLGYQTKGQPVGRPSSFTPELAQAICDLISNGESMTDICARKDMPHFVTAYRWMNANPEFATGVARAREAQAEVMDALILSTARDCTSESAAADRVRIDAYKWRAARLSPKRYGDRVQLAGDKESPLVPQNLDLTLMTQEERQALRLLLNATVERMRERDAQALEDKT